MPNNTQNFRPSRANIGLIYICECGEENYCSLKEAKIPGFKLLCGCGRLLIVDTIQSIKIKCIYIKNKIALSKIQKQAVSLLKFQGFTNCESIVKKVTQKQDTVQDIVKKAVLEYASTTAT